MNVFISYARKDRDFVHTLHDGLVGRKYDAWVDWEDIPPTATWLAEVYAGIEAADTFLFVISPESAASDTCRQEIAHAAQHNKRLIGIVRREVDPKAVPDALRALNWIFFREADEFDASLQTLIQGLEIDLEWVHTHTRLLVRALDWDKRSRDDSLLLRGRDLRDAETALASAPAGRPPAPTALQVQFVLLSRKRADRRRRSAIATGALGVLVASALGYAAWSFSRQRDVQHDIASANALTSQAQLVRDSGANMLPVSLLLALESKRIAPSAEADQLIRGTLAMLPQPVGRLAHDHPVTALAFSPDGRLLASAAEDDANARIWDVATQQELQTLRHSGALANDIAAVAFTPDGSSLITAGMEGGTIWDVATGQQSRRVAATEKLEALAISGDGRYLASGDHDGAVIIRDLASGQPVLQGHHDMIVNALAWSPDGRSLATVSNDKTARVWQVPEGQVLSLPHQIGARGVAWSPDGNWIATGGWEGLARVWERASGREQARFDVKSPIEAVAFDADGTHLIAAADDHTAHVWDLTSGTESARITHDDEVTALAVSPDGRYVATGSKDRTAALWDLGGGDQVMRLVHPEGIVTDIAYSPDGRRLATVCDRTVHVWELPAGHEITHLDHDGEVHALTFSQDGNSLLTAAAALSSNAFSASITTWDVASGRREHQLDVREPMVGFSRDGAYFASGTFKEGALVRDVANGDDVVRIAKDVVDRFTSAVALSPDRRSIAASLNDGTKNYQTFVWNVDGGAQRCRFENESRVSALTFSPDGRSLAAAGIGNTARIWTLDGCRETARIALAQQIVAVAFSPDGTLLATGGRDHSARVWALRNGNELARLDFGGVVGGVTFSPDGKFVAAASSDRTARVWRWRSDEDATAAVCSRVGRSLTRAEWQRYLGDEPYHETCAGLTGAPAGKPPAQAVAVAAAVPTPPPGDMAARRAMAVPTPAAQAAAAAAEQAPEIVIKEEGRSPINAVAFSPADGRLAFADSNGVGFWNLASGHLDGRILNAAGDESAVEPGVIAFSRDGRFLAGNGDGVWVFDLRAGKMLRKLEIDDEVKSIAFSPDAKLLAAGTEDNAILLWDVAAGKLLHELKEHEGTVNSLAFSPDGSVLASGSDDDTTRLWKVSSGDEIHRIESESVRGDVTSVAFSPDGRVVANNVQLLNASTGAVLQTLEDSGGPVEQVAFNPQGNLLAGASLAQVVIWAAKDGRLLRSGTSLENTIDSIAFSADGAVLASAAGWAGMTLWKTADCSALAKLMAFGDADWVAIAPDGRIDGSAGGLTQVRYYEGGKPLSADAVKKQRFRAGLLADVLGIAKAPAQ